MTDAFLDTCIVIDLLREEALAVDWFRRQAHQFGISRIVWFEVMEGVLADNLPAEREKKYQISALKLMQQFQIVEMSPQIGLLASQRYLQLKRANRGISPNDFLVAATAEYHDLPLISRNVKHMKSLLGDLLITPYSIR